MGLNAAGATSGLNDPNTATIAELKRHNLALAGGIGLLCVAVLLLAAGQVRSDEAARQARAEAAACRP